MNKHVTIPDIGKYYKHILDHVPGAVIVLDVQAGMLHVRYLSENCINIGGFTPDEIYERSAGNFLADVHPADRKMFEVNAWDDTREKLSFTYRVICKDGQYKWVSLKLSRVEEDGEVLYYGLSSDVDKLKKYSELQEKIDSEKSIQEEKVRQKLMNYVPSGIGIYDLYRGTVTLQYLNESYLAMMGLKREDREQYYGHDILSVFYPEDRHVLAEMIEEIYQGKRLTNVLFRIQSGSGKWKWINLIMRVVQENEEHYTGYASLHDFDRIVQTQQEMEAAHKKEETLLSSIPGGIAIYHLKKNGRVATEYVSETLAKMCGYTAEEFLAYLKEDSLVNLVPEDIPLVNAAVAESLKTQKNVSVMYRIYKRDRTPILIRLDANMIASEALEEDDIAVFYAVHTLVSDESKRIMEEQKILSVLLNSVPAGIGIFEVRDGVLNQEYMNDAFFEILRSAREERSKLSKKDALWFVHPDDLPRVKETVDELVRGESARQVDYRLKNGLGYYTWFHVTASVTERKEGYIRFFTAFFNCTESKEQELRLLQNERAVELAQTQGDLSIWIYNIDKGIIIQQIKSVEKGHVDSQIMVKGVPECFIESGNVHPDDIDKFLKSYQDLSDGKERVDVTCRLRDQNTGKFAWLRIFHQRMENSNDNDRMAVGFSMNVDKEQEAIERYQVEQALREQINETVLMYMEYNLTKERFETDGRMADTRYRSDWEILLTTGCMTGLLKTVEESYADEVAEKLYSKNLIQVFEAGETRVSVEFRGKAEADRFSAWYCVSASLVKRPDTGDIMAFIMVENIENEKERKLAMECSLSDGIESIVVIGIANKQARIIRSANGAGEKIFNNEYFTYDDRFVWRSHTVVAEEDREFSYHAALLSTIKKQLEHQEIYQYSIGVYSRAGVFKRNLFRFRYLDDRKISIVLSISDITSVYMEEQAKKKQIEQALAETKKASRAKADFYSRMSHDMRTPMNGILGMAALSEHEQDVAVLQENMEKIQESGEYLLSLINDTLDIQRIESGKLKMEPQIVHAAKIIDSMLEIVRPMADAKGVILQYDKGNVDIDCYVRTDPVRVKQIFANLLSNAVKFTPSGGMVRLASQISSRDDRISHVIFTISDTGIGMSEEFMKNGIFQPFSQESNQVTTNYAGSGLGLSIVKSLVEMMGGKIEVKSELGVGTIFTGTLDFERVDKAEARRFSSAQKTKSEDAVAALNGKRILLVEDHPLNAEIARKLLEKAGCVVKWAQNGRLGAEYFASSSEGTFDAILMDIRMPVMGGLEAAKQIRALAKDDAKTIPIIAMTANAYEDDRKKSLEAGMNAHLGKPIEPQGLYETLAEWIGGAVNN